MKEIGTFKIDKNMCSNCREDENCPQKYSVNGNCLYIEKDLIKEQVPETFGELKELCFELPNKIEYYTYNEEELIGISGMYFWQKGRITHNIYDDGVYVYAKNRTPAQMWAIIKNLIGK